MKSKIFQWMVIISFYFLCFNFNTVSAGGQDVWEGANDESTDQLIISLNVYKGRNDQIGISEAQMAAFESAAGISFRRLRLMSGGFRVLSLPAKLTKKQVWAIAKKLERLPMVSVAEPDRRMHALGIRPNDPLYDLQWHYYEPVGGINLEDAWSQTTGSPNVVVAVIDTGILGSHEDIAGRWSGGYDFIQLRFNAGDGDSRDPDPSDNGDWTILENSSWHGTHVAGTIGAVTNNEIGVAGIDWQCQIMPVRALGRFGGFTSDIIDAMRWSAGLSIPNVPDNPTPAHVINMSLGGGGACSTVWQDAVNDVINAGTVLVVAAGNSSIDAANATPASCDDLIAVAATNRVGDLAWYSNYGSKIKISAPGGDTSLNENGVLSTLNTGPRRPQDDAYEYYQGTSMASPHVAGLVALMYSVDPNLTPAQVLTILENTSRPFPAGTDCYNNPSRCGAGIIDAAAAINYLLAE